MLAYITWDVDPRIFRTEYISPAWYGLLFALALVVSYRIVGGFFKKEGETEEQLDKLAWHTILGTVLGARLGHVFFYGPHFDTLAANGEIIERGYLSHPIDILKIWEGGLASHGAALGILIALFIYWRFSGIKRSYLWIVDRIAIVCAIGGSFVRFGNLMNSEIVGKPTDLPWAFDFANSRWGGIPRHPTQLYESFCYVIIFFVLLKIYHAYKRKTPDGLLLGWFLIMVFTARFFIEFLKERQVDFEENMLADIGLNMGQMLSIPFVTIGIIFVIRALMSRKAQDEKENAEPQNHQTA